MRRWLLWLAGGVVAAAGSPALVQADWQPGDGHKMHFPQLPDEDGWDVRATSPMVLADDWTCSQSGPITDIHFWGSWMNGITGAIDSFNIQIFSDDPVGPGGSDPGNSFSQPDVLLWEFEARDFGTVPIDPMAQEGWYNPSSGQWTYPDHQNYFQYNVVDIPNPLLQSEGAIYWLAISANLLNGQWGWKTADLDRYPPGYTGQHYLDDAVWAPSAGLPWNELVDPITFHSLDLAFVITPEPATLALLMTGAGLLIRRRR